MTKGSLPEVTSDLQDAQSTILISLALPLHLVQSQPLLSTTSVPWAAGTLCLPGSLLAAFSPLSLSLLWLLSTLPIFECWSCSVLFCVLVILTPLSSCSVVCPSAVAVTTCQALILNKHLQPDSKFQTCRSSWLLGHWLVIRFKTKLRMLPKQFLPMCPLSRLLLQKLWDYSFIPSPPSPRWAHLCSFCLLNIFYLDILCCYPPCMKHHHLSIRQWNLPSTMCCSLVLSKVFAAQQLKGFVKTLSLAYHSPA